MDMVKQRYTCLGMTLGSVIDLKNTTLLPFLKVWFSNLKSFGVGCGGIIWNMLYILCSYIYTVEFLECFLKGTCMLTINLQYSFLK